MLDATGLLLHQVIRISDLFSLSSGFFTVKKALLATAFGVTPEKAKDGAMNHSQEYQEKLVSAEKAVQVVKSGDWVDYSFCLATPVTLDKALAERKEELEDVKIRGGLSLTPLAVVECDPEQEHFTFMSWHMSGYERKLGDQGRCYHIPLLYRHMPVFYRKSLEVDVAMICVAPMDDKGFFNFSLNNSASRAIVEKAKVVILEVNENLPVIPAGEENAVHISEVSYVVEGENPDIPVLKSPASGETDHKIAEIIIGQLCDGATIQLGVGALPNAIGEMIAASDLKNLGGHTEMLVDAYMKMTEAGKLNNTLKNINRGKTVFTFCAGSKELYDWTRNNAGLAACPVDYVNDPKVMSQNDNLMTINSCLEVDITGQFNSESAGLRQISGTGGQIDFLTGGYLSKGGKSFICCNSTFTDKKTGKTKSRILPWLGEGCIVTAPRSQAHCLVTEWGVADLAGRSLWERAERIINVAHPDFQESLVEAAEKRHIWRKHNK